MAPYKVLIPLDGSRLAETSLAYLPQLKDLGDDDAREGELLKTYLTSIAQAVRFRLSVPVDVQVTGGVPWFSLLDTASTIAPDLLLITTHGRTGVDRWRLGSVADKVIHGASCPVLLVRAQSS